METSDFSRRNSEPIDEASESLFQNRSRWCCCSFPCFDRLRTVRTESTAAASATDSLWTRGVAALMKIREWSELVAGPRWKTFIRRFNRNGRKHANLQYDPLSYAMNFDEGPGQVGHLSEDDDEYFYGSRNFSSRYARGALDQGKNGPNIV